MCQSFVSLSETNECVRTLYTVSFKGILDQAAYISLKTVPEARESERARDRHREDMNRVWLLVLLQFSDTVHLSGLSTHIQMSTFTWGHTVVFYCLRFINEIIIQNIFPFLYSFIKRYIIYNTVIYNIIVYVLIKHYIIYNTLNWKKWVKIYFETILLKYLALK